jgi:hypothetical protein
MHFVTNSNQYLLFADTENTGVYDPNASPSQTVQTESLEQGYAITGLCVVPQVGGTSATCSTYPASEIDILYVRPEPDAYISATVGNQNGAPPSCIANPLTSCYYEAQITLTSPKGDTRTVVVDKSGQISVQLQ